MDCRDTDRKPLLIVITGPTGSGKTGLSVELARRLGCHILSADSRQIFRDIPIGTAAPSKAELDAAPHHFIATLPLDAYYSAACYETDALRLLDSLYASHRHAIVCGGSMMYVDALTRGIDELPTITEPVRREAYNLWESGGIEAVRDKLRQLDPDYYAVVDTDNHKRMIHAIEITLQAGVPFSSLRTGRAKPRPFNVVKMAIAHDRATLFERINSRVNAMMEAGFEEEARRVYPLRHLNSLNTVGYKEMFAMFDGTLDRHTAIERMKKNTRVYAKKQITWLKRDSSVAWLDPHDATHQAIEIISRRQV